MEDGIFVEGVEDFDEGEGEPGGAGELGKVVAEGVVGVWGVAVDCFDELFEKGGVGGWMKFLEKFSTWVFVGYRASMGVLLLVAVWAGWLA